MLRLPAFRLLSPRVDYRQADTAVRALETGKGAPVGGAGEGDRGQMSQALDAIRQEAQKLMGGVGASSPAGGPSVLAPLKNIWKWFTSFIPAPAPMPAPPPAPAPAPMPAHPKPAPAPPKPAPPKPAPAPSKPGGTYTVQKGDSLSRIAQKTLGNGERWREIFDLNRDTISNPNVIHPGMVLKLPGGGNTPAPAPAPSNPSGSPHERRQSWYISQYGSKYNTNEDVPGYDNGNCGPTSLTMVAKAFGKISPNAGQADAAIEESRRRMGDGMNERNGTSVAGIARGAKSYGLDTRTLWNANSGTIAKELAQGRLVIVHGTVIKDDGRVYGGHYYVVTKIENGKAYLSDPAYPSGPRVISAALLDKSIATRGTRAMISVKG